MTPHWLDSELARHGIVAIKSHKKYVQGKQVIPVILTCVSFFFLFILNLEGDVL